MCCVKYVPEEVKKTSILDFKYQKNLRYAEGNNNILVYQYFFIFCKS